MSKPRLVFLITLFALLVVLFMPNNKIKATKGIAKQPSMVGDIIPDSIITSTIPDTVTCLINPNVPVKPNCNCNRALLNIKIGDTTGTYGIALISNNKNIVINVERRSK